MRWEDCRLTRWILSHFSDPCGGPLFALEQLLHSHGLVEMVLGLGDLFTSDQKPRIGVHQVLRSSTASRVELCQGELGGGQALLGSSFTDGQRRLIVASAIGGTRKQRCDQRLCRSGLAQRHEQQFDAAGAITSVLRRIVTRPESVTCYSPS
jgi:hypothetical protein